jgi:hypothetical protein
MGSREHCSIDEEQSQQYVKGEYRFDEYLPWVDTQGNRQERATIRWYERELLWVAKGTSEWRGIHKERVRT